MQERNLCSQGLQLQRRTRVPRLPLQANGFSQPGFRSERGLKITEIRYLQVTFRLKKSIVHFVLWMANRQ